MRRNVARQILSETPESTRRFVRKYADIVARVHELLQQRGLSQKDLAKKMGKSPSEISKWLRGNHNLTLQTIAKLEAELGEDIIYVPKTQRVHSGKKTVTFSVYRNPGIDAETHFEKVSKDPQFEKVQSIVA